MAGVPTTTGGGVARREPGVLQGCCMCGCHCCRQRDQSYGCCCSWRNWGHRPHHHWRLVPLGHGRCCSWEAGILCTASPATIGFYGRGAGGSHSHHLSCSPSLPPLCALVYSPSDVQMCGSPQCAGQRRLCWDMSVLPVVDWKGETESTSYRQDADLPRGKLFLKRTT